MSGDIAWTRFRSADQQKHGFELLRCGPTTLGPFAVLSKEPLAVEVHFWQGKSMPHLTVNCPACAAKRPRRLRGYLAVWNEKHRTQYCLELTDGCIPRIQEHLDNFGTLRGAWIRLTRPSGKANGKLFVHIERSSLSDALMPQPMNLRDYLIRIWQIDPSVKLQQEMPLDSEPTSDDGRPASEWKNTRLLTELPDLVQTDGMKREANRRNAAATYSPHGLPK